MPGAVHEHLDLGKGELTYPVLGHLGSVLVGIAPPDCRSRLREQVERGVPSDPPEDVVAHGLGALNE